MAKKIASRYGVKTYNTLTGFKFIGEKIAEWEATKEAQFLFGYEESYGYLIAPFVRDKDAIQAALLTAEVALEYRLKDQTLFEGLQEIYEQFGYYEESLHTITAKGEEGVAHIQKIMQTMRADTTMNDMIERKEDYQTSVTTTYPTKVEREITLPKSDVLKFHMTNGSWFCIRPSGTEPKCKIYFSCAGETSNEAKQRLNQLEQLILDKIQQI